MAYLVTTENVHGKRVIQHIINFEQKQVEDLFTYLRTLNGDGLHVVNTAFKKLGFNVNDVLCQLPDDFCKRQICCNDFVLLDCHYDHQPYRVKKTRVCKGVFEVFVVPTSKTGGYDGFRIGFWVPEKCCVKVNK